MNPSWGHILLLPGQLPNPRCPLSQPLHPHLAAITCNNSHDKYLSPTFSIPRTPPLIRLKSHATPTPPHTGRQHSRHQPRNKFLRDDAEGNPVLIKAASIFSPSCIRILESWSMINFAKLRGSLSVLTEIIYSSSNSMAVVGLSS